jgi:hypothetical protein
MATMPRKRLASGWHDMRAKKALLLRITLTLSLFLVHLHSFAEKESHQSSDDSQTRTLPEHQVKPLPNDTFKPSEKVSEDFPVPFPVDI